MRNAGDQKRSIRKEKGDRYSCNAVARLVVYSDVEEDIVDLYKGVDSMDV